MPLPPRNCFKPVIPLLLFVAAPFLTHAQSRQVTGTVVSADDKVLGGVSVQTVKAKGGTTTDANGQFGIKVLPGDTLVISYTGFAPIKYPLRDEGAVRIRMAPLPNTLNEVVVVGYNTQSKKDITGAVGTVNMSELKSLPTPSVGDAMQGKAAGVQVIASGAPGNNPEIRIRGISTIGNNSPLLVIDGVPTQSGLNQINMDDVESIQILKDASAAAIYGARGANGVVIITTKRGKGAATQLNFNAYYGIQGVARRLEVLNAKEFAALHNEIMDRGGQPLNPAFGNPDTLGKGTDWLGALLSPAPLRNYTLSYSANTPKTNYYVSGNYLDQEGIVKNTSFKRFIVQLNTDTKVLDNLRFGNSLTLNHDVKKSGDYSIGNALVALPTQPIYNPDGTWAGPEGPGQWVGDVINPIGKASLVENSTQGYNLRGSVYGELTLLKGLRFRSSVSAEASFWNTRTWSPRYNWKPTAQVESFLGQSSNKSTNWLWDNTLTWDKTFGDHKLTALVGTSAQENVFESLSGSRDAGFVSDVTQQLNSSQEPARLRGNQEQWSLLSYFGRLNYAWKDKYLLTGTVRRDGSSRFGPKNKWGVFPSGSLAWRISKEDFFDLPFVSDLKLRAGYGQTGNQEIGLYTFASTLDIRQYNFNNQFVTAVFPTFMPNPNVRWEAVEQMNLGLDASLFGNRANLVLDAYVKNTKDMLVPYRVPAISGFSDILVPPVNAGKVQNRGVELTLNTVNLEKGPLKWNTSFNVSYNRNQLVNLYDSIPMDVNSIGLNAYLARFQQDYPINVFYGYVTDGIFQTQKEVDESAVQVPGNTTYTGTAAGDIRFRDVNNDGLINEKDRQFLGNPNPRLIFGLTNTFEYKGIDLSLFVQGIEGNKIYNASRIGLEAMAVAQNGSKATLERWTGPGTSNTMPRAVFNDPNKNTRVSDRYIEDGSYLRLKNLTVGYTLPKALLQRARMGSARFYLSAQNLYTLTKYKAIDPEVAGNGIDWTVYPVTRTVTFGLHLNF
ncbi:TonB-dependent receptor [Paraflavisolibacter sp. H34]|uniref:SusC/RagA family TonB-linked outer membrane protein n=1 Tax=Huijunlia imazamoxiresistens TaxID=3127457 RepID=UPI00301A06A9